MGELSALPPSMLIGVLGLVIVACLVAAGGVFMLLSPKRTAQDRIRELTTKTEDAEADLMDFRAVRSVTTKVGQLAKPTDEDEGNLLRRRLIQAGYRSRNNIEMYSAARALLALLFPVIFVIILPIKSVQGALTLALMLAAVGYYTPAIQVARKRKARQRALLNPFADALDLLVSSVEAGLGLDAAFRRISDELESAAPLLAAELQQVNHEITAGVPRMDALRGLDHRTGVDEIRQLVNVLAQAEKFGTSVARALRIHSDMVRNKRMLAAEEEAAKISPKLTVIMILFIMPSLFTILMGPAVVQVYRNLVQ